MVASQLIFLRWNLPLWSEWHGSRAGKCLSGTAHPAQGCQRGIGDLSWFYPALLGMNLYYGFYPTAELCLAPLSFLGMNSTPLGVTIVHMGCLETLLHKASQMYLMVQTGGVTRGLHQIWQGVVLVWIWGFSQILLCARSDISIRQEHGIPGFRGGFSAAAL